MVLKQKDLYDIGISRAKKFQRVKRRQLVLKGYDVATAKRMAKRQTNRKWLQGPNRTGIEPAFASASTQVQEHIDTYGTNRYTCVNAKTAS